MVVPGAPTGASSTGGHARRRGELRGGLPEQAPGTSLRVCCAAGTGSAGTTPECSPSGACPSTRHGLSRRTPPVYQTRTAPRRYPHHNRRPGSHRSPDRDDAPPDFVHFAQDKPVSWLPSYLRTGLAPGSSGVCYPAAKRCSSPLEGSPDAEIRLSLHELRSRLRGVPQLLAGHGRRRLSGRRPTCHPPLLAAAGHDRLRREVVHAGLVGQAARPGAIGTAAFARGRRTRARSRWTHSRARGAHPLIRHRRCPAGTIVVRADAAVAPTTPRRHTASHRC